MCFQGEQRSNAVLLKVRPSDWWLSCHGHWVRLILRPSQGHRISDLKGYTQTHFLLCVWDRVFHWTWGSLPQLSWLATNLDSSSHLPTECCVPWTAEHSFYLAQRTQGAGSHSSEARTFLPSPQLFLSYFIFEIKCWRCREMLNSRTLSARDTIQASVSNSLTHPSSGSKLP